MVKSVAFRMSAADLLSMPLEIAFDLDEEPSGIVDLGPPLGLKKPLGIQT